MNILIILCTCFGLTMKEEEREMIWDNNKKITYHAMALVACPRGPTCILPRPWQFPWVSNQDQAMVAVALKRWPRERKQYFNEMKCKINKLMLSILKSKYI